MEQTYMKEKPILPLLLSMALPMVLSMMVNSLYNIIDSYFVAKINENAMTALSLVFPVQNLITAVGVGFGIGINHWNDYHHAGISFHVHKRTGNSLHGNHLLPDHVWFFCYYISGGCL